MKLIISTFIAVLFISTNVIAELHENCQVSNKYNGKCMQLQDCNYYLNMIQNYESYGLDSDQVYETLREVNCGYVMFDVLVCCPIDPGSGNQHADLPQHNSDGLKNFPSIVIRPPVSTSIPSINTQPMIQSCDTDEVDGSLIPEIPQGTIQDSMYPITDKEKLNLLPKECGRVLMYKYFEGNRTEFDDFPWTALLEYETPTGKIFGCGGSLIHNRYVLTAAHCVTGLSPGWKVNTVRFGEYDTDIELDCIPDGPTLMTCNAHPVDVTVEEVIVHTNFKINDPSRLHDIALLRLSWPVDFTDVIKPICLPTKNSFPQKYFASGWGKDIDRYSVRIGTNLKYMSYVSLIDENICKNMYRQDGVQLSRHHICGGAKTNEKPCIGDGGGPLMGFEETLNLEKRLVAFGVLSIKKPATGDCEGGFPSVYTKVLDYMNWILANLRQ